MSESETENGRPRFHQRIETEMFDDMLDLFENQRYATSAMIGAVLYEKLFTTRLIRDSGFPDTPSQDNVAEQIRHLNERERQITETDRLSFRNITDQLVKAEVLTQTQKNNADNFYNKYRNPVSHGLSYRLYETVFDQKPNSAFQIDANYERLYKAVAEIMISEIRDWASSEVLLKQ